MINLAETYRKNKVVKFIQKLIGRKEILSLQLNDSLLDELKDHLLGQIQSIDMVIHEMKIDFDIIDQDIEEIK